jgi:hypothetical protein
VLSMPARANTSRELTAATSTLLVAPELLE